ncbi:EutN/CcmL family microcompartment protein [Ferdinandcohnia quinoae]|uniref:EutN/CcmL family microcompartment protein n=1 Tax=Fredinandcohnia quinoae TaxID=2918902 RepID=A0AAW5E010_9BACI|nr:EutN/CcmL family microcompartment protein [Fredinandcohnia sp. SECRCQ15]MCH1624019.1 EutN/CcmL family microcompartment protein [Fredinandcohnia sp. SECRCQ15]
MMLGKVIGSIWATQKEEGMKNIKLLLVQPISVEDEPLGQLMIAADRIGAGKGERVIISRGSPARMIFQKNTPIDAVVIGIVDSMEVIKDEDE